MLRRGVWSSLRVRLLLLVLLAVVPALWLLFSTAARHRQYLMAGIQTELLRWVRLAAVDHVQVLDRARQLLLTLAKLPEVQHRDPSTCQGLMEDLLKELAVYANLGVMEPDGRAPCSAHPDRAPAAATGLQRVFQLREFTVGEYAVDRARGRRASVTVAYPVPDAVGEPQGAVFAEIDMGWFHDLAAGTELLPGTALMVLDRHGTIVARYPKPARWVGQTLPDAPVVETILTRRAGVADRVDLDGVRRLFAFTLLEQPAAYVSVGVPLSVLFARPNQMFLQGLLWLGIVSLLALAGAWVGGDIFVLRRVKALLDATKRLAAGELGARTGLRYGAGELDQLARTFDAMATALQHRETDLLAATDALRQAHAQLEIRVQERTADLRMANKRLEELSKLKDEMVFLVSHELRNPLVAAKGALDLVLDTTLGPVTDDQRNFLAMVQTNVNHVSELITAILDVSKIEAGRLSLVRRPLSLPPFIETALKSYRGAAGKRTLTAELAPVPVVFADPHRILQVLSNLVSNALKFTTEGGRITVAVQERNGAVAVSVQDDGVGISQEDLPKLFQKFSQVGGKEARRHGTGLGLMLCKQLVELHRGTIDVTSEPGQGSRFTFTLPLYTTSFVLHDSLTELLESAKRTAQEAVAVVALDGRPFVEPLGPFDSAQGPQARGSTAAVLRLAPLAQDDPSTRVGRHPERGALPPEAGGPSRGVERLRAKPSPSPDEPLEQVAQALRRHLLEDDVVLSIEGDRLAVLSITETKEVHVVLRRLRIAVDKVIATLGGPEVTLPVRMGVAVYPTQGTDIELLFAQATRSMTQEAPPPEFR